MVRRLCAVLTALLIACGSSATNTPASCTDDENCSPGELCLSSRCVAQDVEKDAAPFTPIDAAADAELPSSCQDQVQNGDEGDVDCGGSFCPKCAPDDTCNTDSDCSTGQCAGNNICLAATSCLVLRDSPAVPASGVYFLDVDGPGGPAAPFRAYCDMDRDGGGWTLVMKLSSETSQFIYTAPQWSTSALFNENDLVPNTGPSGTEAKYEAFNQVKGTQLHLEWRAPADHIFPYDTLNNRTALELFSGPQDRLFGAGGGSCNGELLSAAPGWDDTLMRHGQGRQFYGINGSDDTSLMRMGFGSNDEAGNRWTSKTAMGTPQNALKWRGGHTDCNDCGGCYGNTADTADQLVISPTSANLWVR